MKLTQIKKLFFDKNKVSKYLDRKTLKVLGKFGGKVRLTAQRSMRKRKGSRKSGTGPPYSHGKQLLRKLLFYSLDVKKKTVIVGPVLLDDTKEIGVPKLMEVGGRISQLVKDKVVTKVYKGNEFMQPAFSIHIGKVAEMYKKV